MSTEKEKKLSVAKSVIEFQKKGVSDARGRERRRELMVAVDWRPAGVPLSVACHAIGLAGPSEAGKSGLSRDAQLPRWRRLVHAHEVRRLGCIDKNGYGNVHRWKVPAQPENTTALLPNGRALRWRYVSKIRPLGVGARQHEQPLDNPDWYFVYRGCVSAGNAN
jgi:hypothetical protein